MNVKRRLSGSLHLHGDKSISHRAVILSAMARGRSLVRNLSAGADVATTRSIYELLGVGFSGDLEELCITSPGVSGFRRDISELYCGNSGTTIRLSLGVLSGSQVSCCLSGDESLNRRPMQRVITPLRQMGADLATTDGRDAPPVTVSGRKLKGIEYRSPVASAQVKSAILLAALQAEGETRFAEPTLSRDHTERLFRFHGIDLESDQEWLVLRPRNMPVPFEYDVAGDISTAVNFVVAAAIMSGSEIRIEKVLLNETRIGALKILIEMGAQIRVENRREQTGEPIGDLIVKSAELKGIDTDGIPTSSFIDEIPILAVASAFADGKTIFRNVGELRVKESNRLDGINEILRSFGVRSEAAGDDLAVEGGVRGLMAKPDDRGDHRLAMAIENLNLATAGRLSNQYQNVVGISAPEFYPEMRRLTE
jgi:3-phosphoshikimate 1-carboxyvinyltransferase